MQHKIYALWFAGLSFVPAQAAYADCDDAPAPVQEALKAEEGWSFVTPRDLDEEKRVLAAELHPNECPGFALADLDGAGAVSYAIALIKFESDRTLQKLVVLRPEGDGFKAVTFAPTYELASPAVVFKAAPGTYERIGENKGIDIATDSIVYAQIRGAATQYYLVKGKMRAFPAEQP